MHSSMGGHLGCFHPVVIADKAAMNIHVQVFVCTLVFHSLGYALRSGIAHMVILFSSLRNLQTVLHSNARRFRSSHPGQDLLFSVAFVLFSFPASLVGVKWYLRVVLFISLMTNDDETLFLCSLATRISSLEEFLFQFSRSFLNERSFHLDSGFRCSGIRGDNGTFVLSAVPLLELQRGILGLGVEGGLLCGRTFLLPALLTLIISVTASWLNSFKSSRVYLKEEKG